MSTIYKIMAQAPVCIFCGKRMYRKAHIAKNVARAMAELKYVHFNAYYCKPGRCWHVGRPHKKILNKINPKMRDIMENTLRGKTLTQKQLKKILSYDPDAGEWRWKVSPTQSVQPFDAAGYVDKTTGYRKIKVCGVTYQSSQLACLYMTGSFPQHEMDHDNRERDDDRWQNLKHTTHSKNMQNTGISGLNTSGVKGISYHQRDKRWHAEITVNGKVFYLGQFVVKTNAVIARFLAEKEHNFSNYNTTGSAYLYLKNTNSIPKDHEDFSHIYDKARCVGRNNTSGVTGVVWDKTKKKWSAQIMFNRKYINLGRFTEIKDAIAARYNGELLYKKTKKPSAAYNYLKKMGSV